MERSPGFRFFRLLLGVSAGLAVLLAAACATAPPANAPPLPLNPMPTHVERYSGQFVLRGGQPLYVRGENPRAVGIARQFAAQVANARDIRLDVRPLGLPGVPVGSIANNRVIVFDLDPYNIYPPMGPGYKLIIRNGLIRLAARTPDGLRRGAEALQQLVAAYPAHEGREEIPNLFIRDNPPKE